MNKTKLAIAIRDKAYEFRNDMDIDPKTPEAEQLLREVSDLLVMCSRLVEGWSLDEVFSPNSFGSKTSIHAAIMDGTSGKRRPRN